MSLSVGIVGLPNAGKSTLFNALAARKLAETAPRPFTTIEPHEAVVSVPDSDLNKLSKLINPEKTIPASVNFIDIAGLVKGAHKGEGMGNQFLGKIREVNAIVHVVRAFIDPYITHQHPTHEPGTLNQVLEDIEIVNIELQLAGIRKPSIYVLNFSEDDLKDKDEIRSWIVNVTEKYKEPAVAIAANLEEELSDFEPDERRQYLTKIGIEKSGLEQLIAWSYKILDLITFYSIKGGKEVTAWSLKKGGSAIEAAEVVHTDFAKNFIKAEVIQVDELLMFKDWKEAKEKGKVGLEGRDYIVADKDVIEFKVNT
jgi:ribosome-binding ATPase YchF (GTP1/OBG family)